jgi:hypothetical protein
MQRCRGLGTRGRHVLYQRSELASSWRDHLTGGGREVNAWRLGTWPLSEGYQIHPFSRAIRYASARDPASSFWVIVAR